MAMLPLLERTQEENARYLLTPRHGAERWSDVVSTPEKLPGRAPLPGEQYRFHFDMNRCIGCKCCVVACNEQNGNPADLNWRRVGELEGGVYPEVFRLHLSMGCNHCLEPSCLKGCPVDAYRKDPVTGLVLHDADMCIGCQYCTWNCSYGVPQYNPERGVVGKCDMCHSRLEAGQEPACVGACPETAIQIEIVEIEAWRASAAADANAPGLPVATDSLSTTRISLPEALPEEMRRGDADRVRPEHPHWPLVLMTVLTQLSVGAFTAVWLLASFGQSGGVRAAAVLAQLLGGLALAASTSHLGRPIHAYRALKMWKRSWLSREVLAFSVFFGIASAYAGALWLKLGVAAVLGMLTVASGAVGIFASAMIYRVRARPAWNSRQTVAEFYLTAAVAGPLLVAAVGGDGRRCLAFAVIGAIAQGLNFGVKTIRLGRARDWERQASARLLATRLRLALIGRAALLAVGGFAIPLALMQMGGALPAVTRYGLLGSAFGLVLAGEIAGRWLFFVSVVPKNMAAAFLEPGREAA